MDHEMMYKMKKNVKELQLDTITANVSNKKQTDN